MDAAGQAHVTGMTQSTNFPVVNPVQATMTDIRDAFVTKLNAAGSGLVYSTYLGGADTDDEGYDITVRSRAAYVTGETSSPGGFIEGAVPDHGRRLPDRGAELQRQCVRDQDRRRPGPVARRRLRR